MQSLHVLVYKAEASMPGSCSLPLTMGGPWERRPLREQPAKRRRTENREKKKNAVSAPVHTEPPLRTLQATSPFPLQLQPPLEIGIY